MNEYVIAFSSFHRAQYAQEKLQEKGIGSSLKKIPPNVFSSCGYAVHLKTGNIRAAIDLLEQNQIIARGVYLVEYQNGTINYRQIA
ncbi:MAG TPA: DUF3343 domain-containing protein [Anaerovoracaceae bacterium]|nr:DUF3343 domain-containing protein [Anaerovoracaceae bacterium]